MSALEHDSASALHPGRIVLPHAAIALVNWGNIILSLNKFRGLRAFTGQYLALLILMVPALVGGVTSLATRTSQFYFQVLAAFVRAPRRGPPSCSSSTAR